MSNVEARGQSLPTEEMLHPEAELVTVDFLRQLPNLQLVEGVRGGGTYYYWGAHTHLGSEEALVYVGLDINKDWYKKGQITIQKGKDLKESEKWFVKHGKPSESNEFWFFQVFRSCPITTLFSGSPEIRHSPHDVAMPTWRISLKDQGEQASNSSLRIQNIEDIEFFISKSHQDLPLQPSCYTRDFALRRYAQVNRAINEALRNADRPVSLPQTEGKTDTSFFPFSY